MSDPSDIDRLIEEGLNRYGAGDLDGALLSWERALAIDPENAQANSYVDYVRDNYEMLGAAGSPEVVDGDATGVPFGIEDEPEYLIEIVPGELPTQSRSPEYMDPMDEGWFIAEEETHEAMTVRAPVPTPDPEATLELEADEPPPPEGISFDDATREYAGGSRPSRELLDDVSDGFKTEHTPVGFSHQETEIRRRELGFVQPVDPPPIATAAFSVRVRTPTRPPAPATRPEEVQHAAPGELALGAATAIDDAQRGALQAAADDLIAALPNARSDPRRITPVRGSKMPAELAPAATPRIPTRDLPDSERVPAPLKDDLEVELASHEHREREMTQPANPHALLAIADPPAPELSAPEPSAPELEPEKPVGRPSTEDGDPMISAPTRELGLRPNSRPPSVYPDEDVPTKQSDARAIRLQASEELDDGTGRDLVLPFDPIDARTAQILDEIDGEEEDALTEGKDDRVRRRITALLDRAVVWNEAEELDKAVTAVDLALSEDPNSALAQKLIHRNRETIMAVFQNYLGDLERQPELARPLHELASAPISPRAAFLLSRIDGMLSIDEILDVSGMPRLEAYRHLCQLFLRGILR